MDLVRSKLSRKIHYASASKRMSAQIVPLSIQQARRLKDCSVLTAMRERRERDATHPETQLTHLGTEVERLLANVRYYFSSADPSETSFVKLDMLGTVLGHVSVSRHDFPTVQHHQYIQFQNRLEIAQIVILFFLRKWEDGIYHRVDLQIAAGRTLSSQTHSIIVPIYRRSSQTASDPRADWITFTRLNQPSPEMEALIIKLRGTTFKIFRSAVKSLFASASPLRSIWLWEVYDILNHHEDKALLVPKMDDSLKFDNTELLRDEHANRRRGIYSSPYRPIPLKRFIEDCWTLNSNTVSDRFDLQGPLRPSLYHGRVLDSLTLSSNSHDIVELVYRTETEPEKIKSGSFVGRLRKAASFHFRKEKASIPSVDTAPSLLNQALSDPIELVGVRKNGINNKPTRFRNTSLDEITPLMPSPPRPPRQLSRKKLDPQTREHLKHLSRRLTTGQLSEPTTQSSSPGNLSKTPGEVIAQMAQEQEKTIERFKLRDVESHGLDGVHIGITTPGVPLATSHRTPEDNSWDT